MTAEWFAGKELATAMQPAAGLLRDVTGSPAAPVFFAAVVTALTVAALAAFRWIERRAPSPRSSPRREREG